MAKIETQEEIIEEMQKRIQGDALRIDYQDKLIIFLEDEFHKTQEFYRKAFTDFVAKIQKQIKEK